MSKQTRIITSFAGGISPYQKIAVGGNLPPNSSGRFMKSINTNEDVNYATVHPIAVKVSGSTVTNLVVWMVDALPWTTDRYSYDQGGNIYKETSGGTWSLIRTVSGAAGQGMYVFNNYLYYAGASILGRYGPLSGTPAFNDNFLGDGTTNIDQSNTTASGQTYTLLTSITESAANEITFTVTRDPIASLTVNIDTIGTGNWTVTVHDVNNNSLGTITVANGSLATGVFRFDFTTQIPVTIGNAYHMHITSTVTDGKVVTGTASNLSTAYYKEHFGILFTDANWHPIIENLNGIVIGNGRYLAFWDEAVYNPNAVEIGPGFNVRSLAKVDEFVIAGCWKGTDITKAEEGHLYYWDGISDTFNFDAAIPFGAPNAITNHKNRLFGIYGTEASMYFKTIGFQPYFQKVNGVPKLTKGKTIEIYPGAITQWDDAATYFGVAGSTTDGTTMEQGVYGYGSNNDALPDNMVLAFIISTGTTKSTSMKIGMVKGFGSDLYIGWKDGATYGVDKVSKTNNPNGSASWESLIDDDGNPAKTKTAQKLVVTFEPLVSGHSITPKYKTDRATSFTSGTAMTTVGATRAELNFYGKRYREIEYGFDLTVTGTSTFPKITCVYFEYDNNKEEGVNES